jgi:hypothetical protein
LLRLDVEPFGEPFDGLEGQVPFSALDGAEVGAVNLENGREALLGDTAFGP